MFYFDLLGLQKSTTESTTKRKGTATSTSAIPSKKAKAEWLVHAVHRSMYIYRSIFGKFFFYEVYYVKYSEIAR